MVRFSYSCIYRLNLFHKPSHNFDFHLLELCSFTPQQLCVCLPRLVERGISPFLSEKFSACVIFD